MLELNIDMKREILANLSIEDLCRFSQASKKCLEAVNATWQIIYQKHWPHIKNDTVDPKTLKDRVIVITLLERYKKEAFIEPEIFRKGEQIFYYYTNDGQIAHSYKDKTTTLAYVDDMKMIGWKITKCAVYKDAFFIYLPAQKHIRSWNFITFKTYAVWTFSSPLFTE